MSEPIPESIPTSMDRRSQRPVKRRALTPTSAAATEISQLMSHADKEIHIPPPPPPPGSSSSTRSGRTLPPPPEIVANVQGSSAGAGSGEFHVYKASRRREYERVRLMEEDARNEKEDREYERRVGEMRKKDEERTGKNRKRREKAKARKAAAGHKGKGEESMEIDDDGDGDGDANPAGASKVKTKVQGKKSNGAMDGDDRDRERVPGANGRPTAVVENPQEIGVVIHDDDD